MAAKQIGKHLDHKVKKVTGTTSLNVLIQNEEWSQVIDQAKAHPGEVRSWSCRPGFFEGVKDSDVLPLHEAVSMGAPLDVIKALVNAFPQGIAEKESAYRRLALHIACRNHADIAVIKYLVSSYALGAATDDILGRLPLHYTCSNGSDPAVINVLMESCPGAARAYDRRGWLPIHVACSVGAAASVVRQLLEAFPPSVVLETNKGSTPRKCADMCRRGPDYAEICAMLEKAKAEYNASLPAPAKRPSSVRLLV